MADSRLGQKALRCLDDMRALVVMEITDAAMPETTITPAAWSQTVAKVDPREQTVFHRGRLDVLDNIRDRIFGGEL